MSKPLYLIKTLPHLVPVLAAERDINLYSTSWSPQIARYLTQAKVFNAKVTFNQLMQLLGKAEWTRVNSLPGLQQFRVRGDIVELYVPGYGHPIRIEFFGDDVEKIYTFDAYSGRAINMLTGVTLSPILLTEIDVNTINLGSDSPDTASLQTAIFSPYKLSIENNLLKEFDLQEVDTDFVYPQLFWSNQKLLVAELTRLRELNYEIKIISKHFSQLDAEVQDLVHTTHRDEFWQFVDHQIPAGFISAKHKIALLTDREIFGSIYLNQRQSAQDNLQKLLQQLEGEIAVGDYIVHADHGVAIYSGLTQEEVGGQMLEYLELQYAGDDKLLVPIDQIHKLTRYIGPEGIAPELQRLGKSTWQTLQAKVKRAVTILAKEMVEHFARRSLASAPQITEGDSKQYIEFVDKFPYQLTKDQVQAINEVIYDLQQSKPMNRLLIGDVGFGKTEVMLRAAFKAAEAGMQVAILCPTTVLAAQHYAVFSTRLVAAGLKVISLSRLHTEKENKSQVELINGGDAQIVIGTHRLLSKDVKFSNLGLLIVDEEQRFGVKQKERIKQINYGVHHLAVSATPIPRTLSMSLSSIQDISILSTAPQGRKPITTKLVAQDWNTVIQAIVTERERGGQVYFVHNEVRNINSIKNQLERLLPGLNVIVGHGQMSPTELDKAMTDFYQGKATVLLATTIIENGLDVPNVNTIIIHQAERFGLSQLYQLRGRVGRSDKQAFCYLVTGKASFSTTIEDTTVEKSKSPIVKMSQQRLEALMDASELGAGFQIASRDLELRGAGDLLGEKQSGHISKVGYALYMQLLASEIEQLKQQQERLQQKPEYITL
jgi:transcription-repair coupling factor (superfamily II helicase)